MSQLAAFAPPPPQVQTFMAFDFGHQRTGIAVGNRISLSAEPLKTVSAKADARLAAIGKIVAEWQPDMLIVGRPSHPDGAAHDMTRSAEKFARQLAHQFQKPVALVDERYTSVEAAQMQAPDLDSMAACLILERYFEQLHEHEKRST
mgnify:CR=1 FL=1